ncbi:MAG: hypothetical protein R3F61_17015 [Myxococcota bacterium]
MTVRRAWAGLLALVGCGGGTPREVGTPNEVCDGYPADAVRPMELGSVLYPYSWPTAKSLSTGAEVALDLGQVPCASDPEIDWSPFDVLLFVSIPAW